MKQTFGHRLEATGVAFGIARFCSSQAENGEQPYMVAEIARLIEAAERISGKVARAHNDKRNPLTMFGANNAHLPFLAWH